MSDEIPECPGRFQHAWGDPELTEIEWGDRHETVWVRLTCGYCECVIERCLDSRSDGKVTLPPLAMCEIEECGRPIWKEGYEHRGDYYCCSSYEVNNFLCDDSPEWPAFVAERNARRRAEAKAKKEASE